jgi:excisionase family DNA binding protein
MSKQKAHLAVAQRAAVQAQSTALALSELLDLYLATPQKHREELFVSTARAAEVAGVSRRTIQSWIDCGDLSAIRIRKCYKVSRDSFREFLEEAMDIGGRNG